MFNLKNNMESLVVVGIIAFLMYQFYKTAPKITAAILFLVAYLWSKGAISTPPLGSSKTAFEGVDVDWDNVAVVLMQLVAFMFRIVLAVLQPIKDTSDHNLMVKVIVVLGAGFLVYRIASSMMKGSK